MAAISISGYILSAFFVIDSLHPLPLNKTSVSTLVTASDGTPLRAFSDQGGVWRYPASRDQVSTLYIEALLNYEDRWFYYHPGFNPLSIARAAIQNIRSGRIVSGGSTLTMQAARLIARANNGRSIKAKLVQIFMALQLEFHLTKDEILDIYLTHAPFGSNIEGVRAAAYTWLGKDALELSHAEAALLTVLPQAPTSLRPDRNPHRAQKARDKVLARLEKYRVWPSETVEAARQEPVISLRYSPPMTAPLLARRLHFQYPHARLISTTIDYDLQVHVQDMVKRHVEAQIPGSVSSGEGAALSGAALVVNHQTMEVKAYVGSADFASREGRGHVDMVQALRSPGSALKPFLYGMAIDDGLIHSASLLLDTPRFKAAYEPDNFTKGFMGPVSVSQALGHSLNVPAVQVLEAYGPHRFHDNLKNAGAILRFPGKPNLSIILGGVGTSLESLVSLYSALGRQGVAGRLKMTIHEDPGRITNFMGRYLLSPGAAWIVTRMLTRPMPGYEGIHKLSAHAPMAWKTGTSFGFRDAWAMGTSGDYVVGVWVGRPDGTPVPGHYGAVTALPLLGQIADALPGSTLEPGRAMPENVQNITVCWPLGNRWNPQEPDPASNCMKKMDAWILDGKIPVTLPEGYGDHASLLQHFWVNSLGERAQPWCGGVEKISVAMWPESVMPWLPLKWQREHRIPGPSPHCPEMAPLPDQLLEITSIGDNSILTRAHSDGETSISVPLEALGGEGYIHWFLNKNPVAVTKRGQSGCIPMPGPGTYQLIAADARGTLDMIRFTVVMP
ncbi:MAG: penicillin-binding protein 1C [Desulfamplus sp.]|nr:penicillin-binding protein 1C [Desulfamplus sp.]